jgi:general secretion pathway protein C
MNAVSWLDRFSTPEKWRGLLQARGPQLANVLLAIAIGGQVAVIGSGLAGASPASAPPIAQSMVSVPAPAPQQHVDIAGIANSHLFGEVVQQAAQPAAIDPANAPPTTMSLVLAGIIAGNDPNSGFAIVGESAQSAKVYAVGDNVPGGARLHSVYDDRVLLDRGGSLESLPLPRQYSAGRRGSAVPPMPAAPPPMDQTNVPMAQRMARIMQDQPGLLSDVISPQPVFAQGKQRGYRVYPGRNRQAFLRLGLRPGDLVLAINGTPLDDPARGQEIFRTLGTSSEAHVTVMRNGRQQDVTLNVAQVAAQAEQLSSPDGMQPTEQAPQMPPEVPVDPAN